MLQQTLRDIRALLPTLIGEDHRVKQGQEQTVFADIPYVIVFGEGADADPQRG